MKHLLTALIVLFILQGCNPDGQSSEDLKAENDSLKNAFVNRDEAINEMMKAFNEIENNLVEIKEKEQIVRVNSQGDGVTDNQKDRINDDILAIYQLMTENKRKISDLEQKLKNSHINISEFSRRIELLNKQLKQKDSQINKLTNQLAQMDIVVEDMTSNIDSLNQEIDSIAHESTTKTEIIDEQDKALHTAYFVVGTQKELKNNNIITKTGGFIGIGRMKKLKENFEKDYFTEIDIRSTRSIPLFCKKAEVITSHPADSYMFSESEKIDSLVITNPDKFWGVSKYLVIVIK